jgi:putative membrane protein
MKPNIKSLFYLVALGAAVGISQPARAAEHHRPLTDDIFAKKAAGGGMFEVEAGKLAAQDADAQDVKDFGSKMVTDHGKLNDQLKEIASKDSLTIPDAPTAHQQALLDRLGKLTGKKFDDAYVRSMVRAHEEDKNLFTQESDIAKNADLKQFASDGLQVITEHLTMIQGIADSHGIALSGHREGGSATSMSSQSASMAPNPAATENANTAAAPNTGDAGQSKGGVGPGSNGNPAPAASGATAPGDVNASPNSVPGTGDAGQSKSGVAPGANGNPATNPQQ